MAEGAGSSTPCCPARQGAGRKGLLPPELPLLRRVGRLSFLPKLEFQTFPERLLAAKLLPPLEAAGRQDLKDLRLGAFNSTRRGHHSALPRSLHPQVRRPAALGSGRPAARTSGPSPLLGVPLPAVRGDPRPEPRGQPLPRLSCRRLRRAERGAEPSVSPSVPSPRRRDAGGAGAHLWLPAGRRRLSPPPRPALAGGRRPPQRG